MFSELISSTVSYDLLWTHQEAARGRQELAPVAVAVGWPGKVSQAALGVRLQGIGRPACSSALLAPAVHFPSFQTLDSLPPPWSSELAWGTG